MKLLLLQAARLLTGQGIVFMLAIVLPFIALVNCRLSHKQRSADELFTENFLSYELKASGQETPIEKAYKTRDFRAVIRQADSAGPAENLFLSALSFLELKQPKPAIERLKKVLQIEAVSGSADWMDAAEYYLAFAFLLDKKYQYSAALLQKIRENPIQSYRDKVKENLIDNIKELN